MQHTDQRGHHENHSGIQLAEPGHDDAGPAHIVGDGGGQNTGGAYLEGSSQTDEASGQRSFCLATERALPTLSGNTWLALINNSFTFSVITAESKYLIFSILYIYKSFF